MHRYPDRCSDCGGRALDDERSREACDDPGRDVRNRRAVGQERQDDREFIAPNSRHGVDRPDTGLHALGRLHENEVTDIVAARVVDQLEAVEVNVEERGATLSGARHRYRVLQPVAECGPVRQAGQVVMVREVLDLVLGTLTLLR